MRIEQRVTIFDAAELAPESSFWAALLGGTVRDLGALTWSSSTTSPSSGSNSHPAIFRRPGPTAHRSRSTPTSWSPTPTRHTRKSWPSERASSGAGPTSIREPVSKCTRTRPATPFACAGTPPPPPTRTQAPNPPMPRPPPHRHLRHRSTHEAFALAGQRADTRTAAVSATRSSSRRYDFRHSQRGTGDLRTGKDRFRSDGQRHGAGRVGSRVVGAVTGGVAGRGTTFGTAVGDGRGGGVRWTTTLRRRR